MDDLISKYQQLTEGIYGQSYGVKWNLGNITPDNKVIVYGAGRRGKELVEYLRELKSIKIVGWVDKAYIKMPIHMNIKSPEDIPKQEYDKVLIAIENRAIVEEVERYLITELGVDEQSIVWVLNNLNNIHPLYEEEYRKAQTVRWEDSHNKVAMEKPYSVSSMICNQDFLDMPFAQYWSERIAGGTPYYHRKLWELVYISQGLYERGFLSEGNTGLSFGTGEECLPDLFASMGCRIVATDLDPSAESAKGWIDTAQNAAGDISKLRKRCFCNDKTFYDRVSLKYVDMNSIPAELYGKFDFCWSACALEHLGSIEHGMRFIENSMKCLKQGGVAIHTTEYNLFSNDATINEEGLCLFRKRDIEELIQRLSLLGYKVAPMDWFIGKNVVDNFVDIPPSNRKNMHMRLLINRFPCTSIGIVVEKR